MQSKSMRGSQEYLFKNHAANKLQEGSADKVYILPMRTNITKNTFSSLRWKKKKTVVSRSSENNSFKPHLLSADSSRNALNDPKRPIEIDDGIFKFTTKF